MNYLHLSSRYALPISVLFLSLVFILLAWNSWMRWPDLLIDFGREAYIPWRLAMGDILYSDILTVNGPLAYVAIALAFMIFGESLLALAFINMAVAISFSATVHVFLRRSCDLVTANLAVLVFFIFFAFSHFTIVGNYNWIMPYSMAYTFGVALCMGMLLCMQSSLVSLDKSLVMLAGILLGLVTLTRMEVLLAGGVVAGFYLLLTAYVAGQRRFLPLLVFFFFGLFLGLGLGLLTVAPFIDIGLWIDELLLPLHFVARGDVVSNVFFLRLTGLIDPLRSFIFMLKATLWTLGGIVVFLVIDRVLRALPVRSSVRWLCVFAIIAVTNAILQSPLLFNGKAFTFISIILAAVCFVKFFLIKDDPELRLKYGSVAMLALFGVCMLAKLPLNPGYAHVGFVMGTAAGIASIVAMVWASRTMLRGNWQPGSFFLVLVCGILLIDCYNGFTRSNWIYNLKQAQVSFHGDTLYGYPFEIGITRSAPYVQQIIHYLDAIMEEHETLAVMPEGITINYLMRRKTSIPYVFFLPTVIHRRGESSMIQAFDHSPPDIIAIIPKNPAELGVGFFGKDPRNGLALMNWVRENYEVILAEQPTAKRHEDMIFVVYRRKLDD